MEVMWAGHYNNRWKLKIRWWNRNCGNGPYCLNLSQRVEIPDTKAHEWSRYDLSPDILVHSEHNMML
jgi:hypothetical protein